MVRFFLWITLVFWFVVPLAGLAQPNMTDNQHKVQVVDMKESTITFQKLTTQLALSLKGRSPSYTFYLPQPKEWKINHVVLNLNVHASSAIQDTSTLTVFVNDTPLKSTRLNEAQGKTQQWRVTIPDNLLGKVSTPIRLSAYLRISEDHCQDDQNEANWVRIGGDSTLTYFYHRLAYSPALAALPYPFINEQSASADDVTIVTATHHLQRQMAHVFRLSYVLGRYARWRGLNISWLLPNALPSNEESNSIIVATVDDLSQFLNGRMHRLDTLINPILDKANVYPETGFLILTKSPWNPYRSLLIVTGKTNEAVDKAITGLLEKNVLEKLSDIHSLAIAKNKAAENEGGSRLISFESLGYSDQIVVGEGKHEIQYRFYLPANQKAQAMTLHLHYAYSPYVSDQLPSYLNLKVNNIPLSGLTLKPDNRLMHEWKIEIPNRVLHPGSNTIQFDYSLNILNPTCSRSVGRDMWGKILNSSTIYLKLKDHVGVYSLKNYKNYFMDKPVIVALPANKALYEHAGTQQALIDFAQSLPRVHSLALMSTDQISEQVLKDHNLIYLGNLDQSDAMRQYFVGHVSQLNKDLVMSNQQPVTLKKIENLELVRGTRQADGVIFLYHTKSLPFKSSLLLVAGAPTAFVRTLSLLTEPDSLSLLHDNLALLFKDKTFTTVSLQVTSRVAKRENVVSKAGRISKIALLIAIALSVLLFIFVAYRVTLKLSQYKKHTDSTK